MQKTCTKCGVAKALDDFPARKDAPDGRRGTCRDCVLAYQRGWDAKHRGGPVQQTDGRFPSLAAFDEAATDTQDDTALVSAILAGGDALAMFGVPIERECAEALLRTGSVVDVALELHLAPRQVRAHLQELRRRAATRGYAPACDMTKTTPEGFLVKGVSTYYRIDHETGASVPVGQWVKTKSEEQHQLAALLDAMSGIADAWKGRAEPVETPFVADDDLLAVYPLGDPHLGMYSWAEETGNHFDLEIAEQNLVAAVDHLVDLAPPARQALIVNLGDFFHADNVMNTTTAGTRQDVDTRWAKVLRAGIRTMRRLIDRTLEKHESVHVITEIGNHDTHAAIMLALCLSQYYEREPRVTIDTSPAKFHWYRFGKNLIGVTHGDTVKAKDLPGVMACDRRVDWGETLHRYWYCGHVHHDSVKEYPGVMIETFRTLAPGDAWHRASGYRSGQDLKVDVLHREYGRVNRHIIGIRQVWDCVQRTALSPSQAVSA